MPPKVKITKKEIISTGIELIRKAGAGTINARNIASALGCSTQPIFSNFATMDELSDAVKTAAYEKYLEFLKNEVESEKYPKYKAFGMAYVRFAKEEKELFKMLFMCDRQNQDLKPTEDFETSVEMIMEANGISREKATLFHLENWTFVHGIGVMLATSFVPFEWEFISDMMSDAYQGLRLRHLSEENK